MKDIVKFSKQFLRAITHKKNRYIRLSPFEHGKIYFYDKCMKSFFNVFVNGRVHSGTADHIFTNHNYDLSFLVRFSEIMQKYDDILSKGDTPLILDCGANIGMSSLYFATLFPNALVLALEPEQRNFELLRKNCEKLHNVLPLNKAVGSIDGVAVIENLDAASDAFRTCRTQEGFVGIDILSVNTILNEYRTTQPFIVKIDIEGFEKDMFSTNTDWIDEFLLLIIETHDWMLPKQSNSRNFLRAISNTNRDFIHHGENIYSIMND